MEREPIELETKVSGMDVQRGIHVPPTLHRSDLAVSGRNALTAGGGDIVTLASILVGTLHIGILNDRRVWNRVAKGLQENLRWTPLDLEAGGFEWDQVHRSSL